MTIHTVRSGDTIFKLSVEYGVSSASIISANGLLNPDALAVGQAIIIPSTSAQTHTVMRGDTMYSIARQNNVTLSQLIAANPQIANPDNIYPGQILNLPGSGGKWGSIYVNGYAYPNLSNALLLEAAPGLSFISIFSYHARADGSLSTLNDQPLIDNARNNRVSSKMVLTNIGESGSFESALAEQILTNASVQEALLNNVVAIMNQKKYTGLNVDFEYVYPRNRDDLTRFMERARVKMDANGFDLTSALAPKLSADQPGLLYEAHDYAAHGRICDHVILMTYEWGYLKGPPMAVAPLNQVRRVIQYAVSEIPPEKILMGIPNYGYDWTLPFVQGSSATVVSNVGAVDLAIRVGAQIRFDEPAQSPFFNYFGANGREHVVWFEDARSIYAKMQLVREFRLGGVSYWTINNSFPQNWTIVDSVWDVRKESMA